MVQDDSSIQASFRPQPDPVTGKVKNTLYWLQPDSQNCWLLSFTQGAFIRKELKIRTAQRSSSIQTRNGNIYILGGVMLDRNNEHIA